jgi:hypothetical protein
MMKRLVLLFAFAAIAAFGQNFPTSIYGLGVGYNGSVSPGAYYGHQVPVPSGMQISDYVTAYAVAGVEVNRLHFNPLALETVATGSLCLVSNKTLGPFVLGDCVSEGGAMTAKAVGNAAGDTPFVAYHLDKAHKWDLVGSGEFLHTAVDNQTHIGVKVGLQYNVGSKPTTLTLRNAARRKKKVHERS